MAKTGSTELGAILAELVAGATKPSASALAGTLGVAIGLLLLCVLCITPELLANAGNGYFTRNADDEWGRLTSHVLHTGLSPSPPYGVLVVAASTIQEAISSGPHLEELIHEMTGKKVAVNLTTAGDLTHWDAVTVLDHVPEGFRGIIVLQVSGELLSLTPERFARFATSSRFAVYSPSADEMVREAGLETPRKGDNYFLDFYKFFLARPSAAINLVRGPLHPDLHRAENWRIVSQAEFENTALKGKKRWDGYVEHHEENLRVFERLIEMARKRPDVRIALLNNIRNPKAVPLIFDTPEMLALRGQYTADITKFCLENDVPYWNLGEASHLEADDFVDTSHMHDKEGRARFSRALAEKLAALVATGQAAVEAPA